MERKYNDEFGIEIVTDGMFCDQGFDIRTIVIRSSGSAVNEWMMSGVFNDRHTYDTDEEWESYIEEKKKIRKSWENKILKFLDFSNSEDNGYNISHVISEIFTVVLFTKRN